MQSVHFALQVCHVALVLLFLLLFDVVLLFRASAHQISQSQFYVASIQTLLYQAAFFEQELSRFELSDLLLTKLQLLNKLYYLYCDFCLDRILVIAVRLVLQVELRVSIDRPLAEAAIPDLQDLSNVF